MGNLEILQKLSSGNTSNWLNEAEFRMQNKYWLDKTRLLALLVLGNIKKLNLTKQEFADKCNLHIDEVDAIVTGKFDICISVIAKIEKFLDIEIIKIEI